MSTTAVIAVVAGLLCLGVGFVAIVGAGAAAYFALRPKPGVQREAVAAEVLPDGYPEILEALAAQTQDAIREAQAQTERAIEEMKRNSVGQRAG